VANAATCTAHSRVDLGVANGGGAGAAKGGVAGRDGAVGRAGSTGRVNDSAYAGCAGGTFSGSRDDSGGMNVPGGCGKLKGTGEAELIWRKGTTGFCGATGTALGAGAGAGTTSPDGPGNAGVCGCCSGCCCSFCRSRAIRSSSLRTVERDFLKSSVTF